MEKLAKITIAAQTVTSGDVIKLASGTEMVNYVVTFRVPGMIVIHATVFMLSFYKTNVQIYGIYCSWLLDLVRL